MNPAIRAAGFTYLRYVNTCSSMVRRCIKKDSPLRKDSDTRDSANIQLFKWVDGKAQEPIMANVQMATASKV